MPDLDLGQLSTLTAEAVKNALREIRLTSESGSWTMAEVDAQWIALFGESDDAPWKAAL